MWARVKTRRVRMWCMHAQENKIEVNKVTKNKKSRVGEVQAMAERHRPSRRISWICDAFLRHVTGFFLFLSFLFIFIFISLSFGARLRLDRSEWMKGEILIAFAALKRFYRSHSWENLTHWCCCVGCLYSWLSMFDWDASRHNMHFKYRINNLSFVRFCFDWKRKLS